MDLEFPNADYSPSCGCLAMRMDMQEQPSGTNQDICSRFTAAYFILAVRYQNPFAMIHRYDRIMNSASMFQARTSNSRNYEGESSNLAFASFLFIYALHNGSRLNKVQNTATVTFDILPVSAT